MDQHADEGEDVFTFHIEGTTSNEYLVEVCKSDRCITCTCPDFQQRQMRCKHIYCLLYRVLGFEAGSHPRHSAIVRKSKSFIEQRAARATVGAEKDAKDGKEAKSKSQSNVRPYVGECCAICLEDMDETSKVVSCTKGCGNSVHAECFGHWSKKNKTCVYCRASIR